MKKFWKFTLIPGLCCLLAGGILAVILVAGFADEVKEQWDDLRVNINDKNVLDYFEVDEYMSITRNGTRYSESETNETYHFAVPEGEEVVGIDFEFAVGEVEVRRGNSMEVAVVDMFENAITSEVKNGVWYIEDSLIDSGSVHSDYSPEITITIPEGMNFEQMEIYLAAGMFDAEELVADKVFLEVDAGSLKVFELVANKSLDIKNGVGEIKVYDVTAKNLTVDNGIGALSFIGTVSGHNTVKCGIGEVKLSLMDRDRVNFNYSIDCGIGEVEIDGNSFGGTVESYSYDRSDADYFELDCGIGRIEIELAGN